MIFAALIGFAFGFVGSMPVAGPIAVLVFTRGVEGRFRSAFAVAGGGALAEMVYAFLAFWGFSAFLAKYAWVVPASRGVAAAVLAVLGVVFVRRKSTETQPPPEAPDGATADAGASEGESVDDASSGAARSDGDGDGDAKGDGESAAAAAAKSDALLPSFILGFTICGLNPTLIATWAAAATTLFSTQLVSFDSAMAVPFALGACVGIVSWFSVLIVLVRRYRTRFSAATLDRIIRVMGVFLIGLAGWFLYSLIRYLVR